MQTRISWFWRGCLAWGFSLAAISTMSTCEGRNEGGADLSPGDRLDLRRTLRTVDRQVIPTLGRQGETLFLIIATDCPPCIQGIEDTYPALLSMAEGLGMTTRLVAVPGTPLQDSLFVRQVPAGIPIVSDTAFVHELQVRSAPTVVVVSPEEVVLEVYSPGRTWPITKQKLQTLRSFP